MNSIYCKKETENGNTFILKIVKMTDHLGILILEESAAYLGKATDNYLKDTAAYYSLDINTYCSNIEKYINVLNPDIKINLTNDKFSISKQVGKMNACYFSVDLQQADFGAMAMNIATELLNLLKDANVKVVETNDRLLQAQAIIDTYKNQLEKYTNEHISSENQLYSSFLLILNEKKRQLRFYKDLLDKSENNQISKSPTRVSLSDNTPTRVILSDNSLDNDEINVEQFNNEKSADNKLKRTRSFDSDGEPTPGPSKTTRKSLEKNKSADFNTTKLNSRSKSDTDINSNDNFDFFDADVVLPPKLPKRVNKSTSNLTAVVKTATVCTQIAQNDSIESQENTEDSPTLNFTTQDLFDRL